jgi:hypothetical protein
LSPRSPEYISEARQLGFKERRHRGRASWLSTGVVSISYQRASFIRCTNYSDLSCFIYPGRAIVMLAQIYVAHSSVTCSYQYRLLSILHDFVYCHGSSGVRIPDHTKHATLTPTAYRQDGSQQITFIHRLFSRLAARV